MRCPLRTLDDDLRETEKPKSLGNSSKSFLSRVLLPTPEGPESTIGRLSLGMGGVDAQLEFDMLAIDARADLLTVCNDDGDGRQGLEAAVRSGVIQRFIRVLMMSCTMIYRACKSVVRA